MVWFVVMHLFTTQLDWVKIGRLADQEKNLEILVLRQHLRIAERSLQRPVRVSRDLLQKMSASCNVCLTHR